MSTKEEIVSVLRNNCSSIKPIIKHDLNAPNVIVFDFSGKDSRLAGIDISNVEEYTRVTFDMMKEAGTPVAIGSYNENRTVYAPSPLFNSGGVVRTVHIGVDLWAEAGTPIFVPLLGKVHSFNNNDNFGDYGPTIVLEHEIDGVVFYTLYGHLSLDSIYDLKVGQYFAAGEELCRLGNFPVNGNWPPHLHFQIMTTMMDKRGDFPGVTSLDDLEC